LVGRVGEDCHTRRDTTLNQVRRFEDPRTVGIHPYNNDIGRPDGLFHNERPTRSPENRFSNAADTNNDCPH